MRPINPPTHLTNKLTQLTLHAVLIHSHTLTLLFITHKHHSSPQIIRAVNKTHQSLVVKATNAQRDCLLFSLTAPHGITRHNHAQSSHRHSRNGDGPPGHSEALKFSLDTFFPRQPCSPSLFFALSSRTLFFFNAVVRSTVSFTFPFFL